MFSGFSGGLTERWQRCAFGLGLIPHVNFPESAQRGLIRVSLFGLRLLLAFLAVLGDHRRKNGNAFFPALDPAAKLVPCLDPCNVGCRRPLSRDQKHVPEGIAVKVGHCVEKRGEGLAVSGF